MQVIPEDARTAFVLALATTDETYLNRMLDGLRGLLDQTDKTIDELTNGKAEVLDMILQVRRKIHQMRQK